jgi:hypothetical protein
MIVILSKTMVSIEHDEFKGSGRASGLLNV